MQYPFTHARALAECPAKAAEARAALAASRSKKKALADKDLNWTISMAARIQALNFNQAFFGAPAAAPAWKANVSEALRETDPQAYCDAKIASGEFLVALCCEGYASSPFGPGEKAPSALVAAYAVAPTSAAPASGPAIYVHMPNALLAGIHEIELEGVYEKGSRSSREIFAVPANSPMLHQLDEAAGIAAMSGGFAPAASKAFAACAPGASFKYRNIAMRRWSDAEIASFLAGAPKIWTFGMGSAYGGLGSRMPKAGAPTPNTPVFPSDADSHPNPKPIGTAASMGLLGTPAVCAKSKKI